MTLREMRQARHDLAAKGNGILKKINDLEAKDQLTNTETEEYDRMTAEVDAIESEVRELDEKIQQAEERADAAARRSTLFGPAGAAPAVHVERPVVHTPVRELSDSRIADILQTHAPRSMLRPRTDFRSMPEELNHGFATLAEFAHACMVSGRPGAAVDPRLAKAQQMYAQPDSLAHREQGTEEGYMVPPAMRAEIWEIVFEGPGILSQFILEPTGSPNVQYLRDETTPWGSLGVQAYWVEEAGRITVSKLSTKGSTVGLMKLAALVQATDELLMDAPRLADRLTRRAALAIRWNIEDAIIYGNGVGKPQGFFTSGAAITVPKEGSQATATIETQNIAKMYSRMLFQPMGRPFWMANSDTVPQLIELNIGGRAIWTMADGGLREAPANRLMGYPLQFTEHAQTLGARGDIQFNDPEGYYGLRRTGDIQFASSIHLLFDYDMEAFRWTIRVGGQPFMSAPMTPAHGTNTKSHFISLAERA